jgi:hypothetical protein
MSQFSLILKGPMKSLIMAINTRTFEKQIKKTQPLGGNLKIVLSRFATYLVERTNALK